MFFIFGEMKPEETIDFHIKWAWHKISKFYNSEAQQHGITMAMGYVLLNIDSKEGTPATSLGPKMGMEPRSISRLLNSMEEKGLIERKPDEIDKRINRVFLTSLGKEGRAISRNTVVSFNENIQKRIPSKKLQSFFEVMSIINENNFNELEAWKEE